MLFCVFEKRSYDLEIIDTDDYTPAEYEQFLREIRFINRWLGDVTALKQTLLDEIAGEKKQEFSVLDVGAGSGELLRVIAKFARKTNCKAALYGLELNARSCAASLEESKNLPEIKAIRGNALNLPFADRAFDYVYCSLFTHHFTDEKVLEILSEMRRVARRKIFVIDLHRHKNAYLGYKLFRSLFLRGRLAKNDGLLSILRSFVPEELEDFGIRAGLKNVRVTKHVPARLVLSGEI
jgi:SAM-dependent methyltransferase